MAVCAPTSDEALGDRARVVRVVPEGRRPPDRAGRGVDGGAQAGARQLRLRGRHAQALSDDGSLDLLSLEYLVDTGACVLGTPDQCVDACKRYEAAGVDLLLCLVNPYKIRTSRSCRPSTSWASTSSRSSPDARSWASMSASFEIVCEIEPATRPDLQRVRHADRDAARPSPTRSSSPTITSDARRCRASRSRTKSARWVRVRSPASTLAIATCWASAATC